jgi:dihydrolipoamide dehydrogenase
VIGGGIIGLELGSVYARLGTKVQVVEYLDRLIPGMDFTLAKEILRCLKKLGIEFKLSHAVQSVKVEDGQVAVLAKTRKGEQVTFTGDYCLVAVGRHPYTAGLKLENAGLSTDERGRLAVDDHLQTSVPGIYAIGDVVRGPMLAHKAEDEGVLVAEVIDGQKPHIDYNCIPWVIYTYPEIAWVGKTEQQLKAEGREIKTGKFPFSINGRALGMNAPDGFVKMIADAKTDELLGVHVIAANASDLIAEAVVAMEFKAASEDIARICHPHPSMSEVMREAALAVDKRSLNS